MARKPKPPTTRMVNFRLAPEVIARLDAYAADLSAAGPIRYSRTDALLVALHTAFTFHDASTPARRTK